MHCSAPICSDLSYLSLECNSIYSVTVFPKQGKMEQVTAGCSNKMVVKSYCVTTAFFNYDVVTTTSMVNPTVITCVKSYPLLVISE